MSTKFTAYSTKYWETAGIQEHPDCDFSHVDKDYVVGGGSYGSPDYIIQRVGKDIFLTRTEAVASVRKKAVAKLKSLDKKRVQVERLLASLNE